jgi:hypothetical protein
MIADCWNDETFNPKTKVSSCHTDFSISIDCSHTIVASLAPATVAESFVMHHSEVGAEWAR